ncbi:STAS domain-containing protein [Pseudonocardia sp. KRD-184]|uniref:STAS domain-containing protein n=1 Tax=Pseudonocardia oceani TaxID=2792013 RepID=A0ABS6U1S8_9PSEU|nr:STAS domain-containing protein [Pseudonocardia oceani]MBW0093640.1 STAS domain-containing protein [Pseudonocardia oceani]MBW0100283.1 STAS domain-containing protein [Pseudonocardia oceani]MBW0112306.1 STAS domain-containing protein [Pseudonocardia oceani]MBW0122403.1 STAS domain-containing protein [Pseudonocardia oceani]MBW0126202.1 STAS domain-containing protein [Pseudonocardia oceani]
MDPLPRTGTPGPPLALGARRAGEVLVVSVAGELDAATTPELQALLDRHRLPAARHLVLDLGGVTFASSAGVNLLVEIADAPAHAPALHLAGTENRVVSRLLEITGLTGVFCLHPTVDDALREH